MHFHLFLSARLITVRLCVTVRALVLKQALNILKSLAGAWRRGPVGVML